VSLQCEVVVDDAEQLGEVVAALAGARRLTPVQSVALFDKAFSLTTEPLVRGWEQLAADHQIGGLVFAGTAANFAELNRGTGPYQMADGVTLAMNPQVRAFGDDEVMSTLPVQRHVAAQAVSLAGGLFLYAGRVTLVSRFNAVATSYDPAPVTGDPCQSSNFAAAWALGEPVCPLAPVGPRWATYLALTGPHGLIGENGTEPGPLYPGRQAPLDRGQPCWSTGPQCEGGRQRHRRARLWSRDRAHNHGRQPFST
jgi:hypothetical protein